MFGFVFLCTSILICLLIYLCVRISFNALTVPIESLPQLPLICGLGLPRTMERRGAEGVDNSGHLGVTENRGP